MIKPDEVQLLTLVLAEHGRAIRKLPREIAADLGIHPNRAQRIFEKWHNKRWMDSGVSEGTGWLLDEAIPDIVRAIDQCTSTP